MRILSRVLPAISAGLMVTALAAGPALASQTAHAQHAAAVSSVQPADIDPTIPDPDPFTDLEPNITATPMCLVSGGQWCAWATNAGTIADGFRNAGPNENVKFNRNGNTFSWNGHSYPTGTLNMPGRSPACIGISSNAVTLDLENCSTGIGTIWGHATSNGHDVWVSRFATQANNTLYVYSSHNGGNGSPQFVGNWRETLNFKRWSF